MLRSLLGEAPGQWEGLLGETDRAMGAFIGLVRERSSGNPEEAVRFRTYAIWAEGLRRSLEELEESIFAAGFFAARIQHERWGELSGPEKKDYDRHVYFDKNAYIRMFSLLDKLGTLMNDLLGLKTEKIKPKFSYFTVLRRMRETGRYPELAGPLTALKETNRDAMNRLRTRRNTEIHFMNAELQDDLFAEKAAHGREAGETGRLENLSVNLADLRMGWDMVLGTLERSFRYACDRLRHRP
ncbi:Cthe_2314 family HEPN domain-containing protein [Cohnella candidum]|uniref:Cthe_2314 family HEPN domain-containing protein n=1 Tax=Cohnella candidum TaxID=2674991 RepID=UPI0013DE6A5F|nr:Cthe_2314 family HEPN domain-containing protein [Cohnella candidum]